MHRSRAMLGARRLLGASALALLSSGCASVPHYTFTPTGARIVPKSPNCRFAIVDMRPDRPFDEVGRVDVDWHPFYTPSAESPDELRRYIQRQVCAAGGDAVIAKPDCSLSGPDCPPNGRYFSGKIIRYVDGSR